MFNSSYRQFCLPEFAHVELSLAQEVQNNTSSNHSLYLMKFVEIQQSLRKQAEWVCAVCGRVVCVGVLLVCLVVCVLVCVVVVGCRTEPASERNETNDLHVSIAASHHGNVSLSSILHHLSGPNVCSRSKHSQDHGRRLNHICQPNTPRRLNPICQPNSEHHDNACERTETSVRHGWKLYFGLQCSRLKVAAATKIVVAGERPDPGASPHHRHDAGAPSVLHRA